MQELKKRFYKRFVFLGITYTLTFIALTVIACIQWIENYESKSLLLAIFFTICAIVIFALAAKELIPYFKDWKYLKNNGFLVFIGEVTGYKVINYSSDPPTTEKFPIVKNISNNEVLTLNVDDAKEKMKYKFAFLPNTQLAVVLENLSKNTGG